MRTILWVSIFVAYLATASNPWISAQCDPALLRLALWVAVPGIIVDALVEVAQIVGAAWVRAVQEQYKQ